MATGTNMRTARRRAGERGFTMVELIAYLGIFTSLTATMVGAELAARKLNRAEATVLEAMYTVDRVFGAIAEDCDRATGVYCPPAPKHEVSFTGGSTFSAKDGVVTRDGKPLGTELHHVRFFQPDPARHPRLLTVEVTYQRTWGTDSFARRYERTFLVRNLEGDYRGGL